MLRYSSVMHLLPVVPKPHTGTYIYTSWKKYQYCHCVNPNMGTMGTIIQYYTVTC